MKPLFINTWIVCLYLLLISWWFNFSLLYFKLLSRAPLSSLCLFRLVHTPSLWKANIFYVLIFMIGALWNNNLWFIYGWVWMPLWSIQMMLCCVASICRLLAIVCNFHWLIDILILNVLSIKYSFLGLVVILTTNRHYVQ